MNEASDWAVTARGFIQRKPDTVATPHHITRTAGTFGTRVSQSGLNMTNQGLFLGSPNVLKFDWKKPQICAIWGQFSLLLATI